MTILEHMELWSYVVTIVGLPMALFVFIHEQRKERENEEGEIYDRLMDGYSEFIKLVIENADLQLRSNRSLELTDEQKERRINIFDILVSLFERAYILTYEKDMDRNKRRRWQSWEDYMREWCCRKDFRHVLPDLLEGEDEEFVAYIKKIAVECEKEKKELR
ncbi:MAG: hypothetical protein A2293_12125 [Elusimicrobia bacterium RIFOXYB2_FULL_49_7]|nr:MAG: hypothetical protein A2293_12125 [Elusimicrobia bacterium RIFOXYB2_FULL_49_7]